MKSNNRWIKFVIFHSPSVKDFVDCYVLTIVFRNTDSKGICAGAESNLSIVRFSQQRHYSLAQSKPLKLFSFRSADNPVAVVVCVCHNKQLKLLSKSKRPSNWPPGFASQFSASSDSWFHITDVVYVFPVLIATNHLINQTHFVWTVCTIFTGNAFFIFIEDETRICPISGLKRRAFSAHFGICQLCVFNLTSTICTMSNFFLWKFSF